MEIVITSELPIDGDNSIVWTLYSPVFSHTGFNLAIFYNGIPALVCASVHCAHITSWTLCIYSDFNVISLLCNSLYLECAVFLAHGMQYCMCMHGMKKCSLDSVLTIRNHHADSLKGLPHGQQNRIQRECNSAKLDIIPSDG